MPKLDKVTEKLGALKGLAEIFLGPKDVVGIDVGSYSVKAVLFQVRSWRVPTQGLGPYASGREDGCRPRREEGGT